MTKTWFGFALKKYLSIHIANGDNRRNLIHIGNYTLTVYVHERWNTWNTKFILFKEW